MTLSVDKINHDVTLVENQLLLPVYHFPTCKLVIQKFD